VIKGVREQPDGFTYQDSFLTDREEAALVAVFEAMEFDPVVLRGHAARRTVRHFGYGYDFDSWRVRPTEPIPSHLLEVRDRCSALAGCAADGFQQALVTRYPAGSSIGWHKDASAFGPVVLGVSLAGGSVMRFQRTAAGGERRVFEQPMRPGSAYALAGAARAAWQHSIPAVQELRYSITFRSVRGRAGPGE